MLKAGDQVMITGELLTARDAACGRLAAALKAGDPLPVDLAGRVIYAVGPTPAKPGQVIGSAGPTTAARLLPYLEPLLKAGVKALIGKGDWPPDAATLFARYGAVYLAAVGGAGALIARTVRAAEVIAYPDLGPEAVHRLSVERFPAFVAVDARGADLYRQARDRWRRGR
ncbi:MAG: fumarate hydratase C-terminal domain-containing protein [Firmicutes bacterium]|nr:fumarate hydratase C-terminal domain-containing protein [Bacillota bacterium]